MTKNPITIEDTFRKREKGVILVDNGYSDSMASSYLEGCDNLAEVNTSLFSVWATCVHSIGSCAMALGP